MITVLHEGVEIARLVESVIAPAGWHCALHGGVLIEGHTNGGDVDLMIYPHDTSAEDFPALYDALRSIPDMKRILTKEQLMVYWRRAGSVDEKWVEVWSLKLKGKRYKIDLFHVR